MAYNREKLIELSLTLIQSQNLVFVDEIAVELGVSKSTFYNHKLHELDELKDALAKNRARLKRKMRKNWEEGSAACQIALYKLLANKEELAVLNGSSDQPPQFSEFKVIVPRPAMPN